MNADRLSSMPLTVTVTPTRPGAPLVLELLGSAGGSVDGRAVEAAVERALRQALPYGEGSAAWRYRLRREGPGRHTLTLEAPAGPGGDAPVEHSPVGLIADLLTATPAEVPEEAYEDTYEDEGPYEKRDGKTYEKTYGPVTQLLRATPLQRELLADAEAWPGAGVGIGQLSWDWDGPLDVARSAAAWRSVHERESVLRAAFDGGWGAEELRVAVHAWVTPRLLRLRDVDWFGLLSRDRRRGLDPRRPGPVRVTLLEGVRGEQGGQRSAHRMLLTYHHALLDDLSARLLLREFVRAYLAGGRLPGGERRPDIGDYSDWLEAQDLTPAREFWARAVPLGGGAVDLPVRAVGEGAHGRWRARCRLTPGEAERLRAWAGRRGCTEFGALQAAWAMLLHRASGGESGEASAGPVRFSVSVSGRGVPLDSVDRMPGALSNSLPVSVVVSPDRDVAGLLADVGERGLDRAAYEWVAGSQIAGWAEGLRRPEPQERRRGGALLAFRGGYSAAAVPVGELGAQGVVVQEPTTYDADTGFPLTLTLHADREGGLVLTCAYEPGLFRDVDGVLADLAWLLRRFPGRGSSSSGSGESEGSTDTVGSLLGELAESGEGRAGTFPGGPGVRVLRSGAGEGEAVVCLVSSPGLPQEGYEQLALAYRGLETVVQLSVGGTETEAVGSGLASLLRLLDDGGQGGQGGRRGRRLVLAGFSGCGSEAYTVARLVERHTGGPVSVVVFAAGERSDFAALARTLAAAAGRGR
ncbi:condensation domain-containing protein [Streptomyces sp. Da 82-17]|uniref:condensation domain-containing protein n=1 Tax=Streptomyces sp. Da 82-17 TaxID=3377116 RepID=UPI0038D4FC4A